MQPQELEPDVRQCLDLARETLGAIEMHVREAGEAPALMEASRRYAELCMVLREYLSSLQQRQPRPRRLADRADAVRTALTPLVPDMGPITAQPTPDQLAALSAKARSIGPA